MGAQSWSHVEEPPRTSRLPLNPKPIVIVPGRPKTLNRPPKLQTLTPKRQELQPRSPESETFQGPLKKKQLVAKAKLDVRDAEASFPADKDRGLGIMSSEINEGLGQV